MNFYIKFIICTIIYFIIGAIIAGIFGRFRKWSKSEESWTVIWVTISWPVYTVVVLFVKICHGIYSLIRWL